MASNAEMLRLVTLAADHLGTRRQAESGLTDATIAAMAYAQAILLGCSPAGVKSACGRHGIKAGPRRGTRRLGVKSERAWRGAALRGPIGASP